MAAKRPTGLKTRGRRLWDSFTERYEFSPAEGELLVEACRTLDLLDLLERHLVDVGLTVTGSKGQDVMNPSVTALATARATLTRLLAALAPDPDAAASMSASKLASMRWGRRGA